MKKILASLTLTGLLVLPAVASAGLLEDIFGIGGGGTSPTSAPQTDVMVVLDSITDWLFALLLIVAVIAIIIAGYYFITAQGDPDKVSKARNFVLYAVIGVLVGFIAKGLVALVGRVVEPAT